MTEARGTTRLWPGTRPVVGMIHLEPLPGSPAYGGDPNRVLSRASADARALVEGGVDAVLVENYGDAPFFPDRVPPETTAAMAVALQRVRTEVDVPVGVNVLRNDVRTALGIAATTGAAFVRCNVHTGTMFTDQGVIEGRAHDTLRLRSTLCPDVAIAADVFVKHATHPVGTDLVDTALDTWHRGLADALIVTGAGTGRAAEPGRVARIREALPEAVIWVGSGVTASNATELLEHADGAIVGSAFQKDGRAGAGVEVERVRSLIERIRNAG